MATKGALKRLTKEYLAFQADPPPFLVAKPLESNILEWHYILTGPPETIYAGGQFYGKLVFPSDYPFKPPSIRMLTPSGRFQPNMRICLTSTWNPSWSVATILNGLLSFMIGNEETTGSIKSTPDVKRKFALESFAFNAKNKVFGDLFPEAVLFTPPKSMLETKKNAITKELPHVKEASIQPPNKFNWIYVVFVVAGIGLSYIIAAVYSNG